ncbi:MAG: MHYT domain-containing protein [Oscillatoria sp. PMC 1068.18]|nr:MHYT domain-containing protein [Oscillatoria sp. PMC 1076.18]MEC4988075.1 MHYT domain-containing protein [Oscillatoria sp. PMC 1068.18]
MKTVVGSYEPLLVILSLTIAVMASYTALDLAGRIPQSEGRSRALWAFGGAVAMGTGIWSMHFIAMLALELPIPAIYDVQITLVSWLDAIAASGVALWLFARPQLNSKVLFGGGIVMGLAIASMHYLGMWGMQVPGTIMNYNQWLVALSIVVAIAAASIALWLAFSFRISSKSGFGWLKLGSAVVMGIAISGMHYTGMWGTSWHQNEALFLDNIQIADNSWLATEIGIATFLVLLGTLISSLLDRRYTTQLVSQEALQASEKRFRSLIREMPVAVLLLDPTGEINFSNQLACEILSITEADLQGNNILVFNWELIDENSQPFPLGADPISEAIKKQEARHNCVVGVCQSASENPLWLLFNIDPQLTEKSQKLERIVCTFSNITETKQAEAKLQESSVREKAVARAIQRMRQSLNIEKIFSATTSELRQTLKCDRVGVYRFNPDWSGQFVAESVADGWISVLEEQNNDSELRKKAIANQQCSVNQFESNGKNSSYLGNNPALIEDTYLQDTQGGIYSQGVTYRVVKDIYQAGFDDCYLNLLERFQAKAYIIVPIFVSNQLWGLLAIYQNHSPRQWKNTEINIAIQIGNQLGVALNQAELLAQTQKQSQALEKALLTADTANQAKSEFLANMSHELRTPLNAILGFSQIMSRDDSLSPTNKENIEIINRAGEHLLSLINDILEMSKIEAGRITLNETNFDLIDLLNTLQQMLQLKAEAKGLQLIWKYDENLPRYIRTDEGKLRQVLLNLLGNAIKFTAEGSITLRAKTVIASQKKETENCEDLCESQIEFQVEDTGLGIACEEISLLFEPFKQTETGRNSQQGTGLGLTISRKYIQLMGGDIQVTSQLGLGSIFAFNVKVTKFNSDNFEVSQQPEKAVILASNQKEYRILVTEDIPESRLLLVKLLSSIGFAVSEARNGAEAIKIWQTWQPDLVFMDMRMPVMDGLTATRKIKAQPEGKATKIIALTASAFTENRQEILVAGCDDVVTKPFREKDLLEKISQHLGVKYVYQEKKEFSATKQVNKKQFSEAEINLLLREMPSQWRAKLHHSAAQCSDEKILALIQQIPPEKKVLADFLNEITLSFQFDKILHLLDKLDGIVEV